MNLQKSSNWISNTGLTITNKRDLAYLKRSNTYLKRSNYCIDIL